MAIVLDLDGVVWRGTQPIAGSAEAIRRLRDAGRDVRFLTNNSAAPLGDHVAKLQSMAIAASVDDVLTSAQAAASLVDGGEKVLICAGDGVREAVLARGATPVDEGPADTVLVGWHTTFDYERLTVAMRAVLGGARLIGTNDDPTYPVPDGFLPGGGALLAAVAYASGAEATIAGKPFPPTVELVQRRVGDVAWVVGDRPSTDGRLAAALGVGFALVLSGVTDRADGAEPAPAIVGPDLAAVVPRLLE